MFFRGHSHAWTEEAESEAIRGWGRKTLPRTEEVKKEEEGGGGQTERDIIT